MPQPTLHLSEVREALEHFRAQGVMQPGLLRLQRYIGHGSIPRLRRLLHEIQMETLDKLAPDMIERIPDPITKLAAQVWTEIENALEDKEQQLKDTAALEIEKAHVKVQALEQQLHALEDDCQTKQGEIDAEKQSVQALQDKLQAATEALMQAQQLGLSQKQECEHLHVQLQSQRAEQAQQAKYSAQREAKLLASLDMERQRSYDDALKAQQHLHQCQAQLASVQTQLAELRATHTGMQAQSKAQQARLEQQLQESRTLSEALAHQVRQQQEHVATLHHAHATLASQQDTMQHEIRALEQKNQRLEAKLKKAQRLLQRKHAADDHNKS